MGATRRKFRSIEEAAYAGYFLPIGAFGANCFVAATQHPRLGQGWLCFQEPISSLTGWRLQDVREVLVQGAAAQAAGNYVAGFVAYDAAPAFDQAFHAHGAPDQPLCCIHIYDKPPDFYKELPPLCPAPLPSWTPDTDYKAFATRFATIKSLLAQGVTYQVNYTFRLEATEDIDLSRLFVNLAAEDAPAFASFFRCPSMSIASLSPELFFETSQGHIKCKPMKGTAPRGNSRAEDEENAVRLRESEKERAENLMVVDMIRSDLGRLADFGSVRASALFEVEALPTVLQMTSTVEAQVSGDLPELFDALFPCASIVGAPKASTTKVIYDLETSPRGVYTGALGWCAPEARSQFAVAIRTISARSNSCVLTYGVGSGIVWDSDCDNEWRECQLKAGALSRGSSPWGLLETMRWTKLEGYWLLDRHLERLLNSARELQISTRWERVHDGLAIKADEFVNSMRVRLILHFSGEVEITAQPLGTLPDRIAARLAREPVASQDPGLRFKTTRRSFYERQMIQSGADEAVLWNELEEATEFCNGNLVASIDGKLVTPPLECGLLPGVFRSDLLQQGKIIERRICLRDLVDADQLFRINSVRGWVPVELESPIYPPLARSRAGSPSAP